MMGQANVMGCNSFFNDEELIEGPFYMKHTSKLIYAGRR